MSDYLALFLGVVFAGLGGELFIRGTVSFAKWLRVSAGVIGATVVAFATSSPELSVAVSSSIDGKPEIALGDTLGSNILNIGLVLGIALLFADIRSPRREIRRNLSVALFAPILVGLLAYDGSISRIDGLVLLIVFAMWITNVTLEAHRQRSAAEEVLGERRGWLAVVWLVLGLGFLIAAGRFIVYGAGGIAEALGLGKFVIGAVVVAVGTSVPELATTIISRIRGHDEVGLNTVLGSNIFNAMFIIAVASIICPITLVKREVMTAVLFGVATIVLVFPTRAGIIGRWRGVVLLLLYFVFVFTTFKGGIR